ncbi:MAG TPA: phytanoyl-CoA dioxygenase family protein [Acidimicrobiales bacterium]|nr:phytanoyl-CoA dioxygenase family protein [Acidimicrobiales bacterium]
MSPQESARWRRDGYLVRQSVFTTGEVDELRRAAEEVAAAVKARATRVGAGPEALMADGHRIQFSSHAAIQWEWRDGSQEIRLVEPCDHLHPAIAALFGDPRLLEPMRDAVDAEDLAPFTCKLNLKRAVEGSEFPFHQDYPYWYVAVGDDAARIATAVVFLDDATAQNGAVRVIPGSHAAGAAARDPADPTGFLADPARLAADREVTVEVPAGSVLMFGAFLVHRSSPNRTAGHRRALLPSFQPAGRPRLQERPYRRELVRELP